MALTPEDVVNKRFQQTKFREGYDQDEVDDFLDEIVVELRRLSTENAELREKLAEAGSGVPVAAAEPVAAAPAAVAPAATKADDADAASSANDLLTLARRLHEEHVQEGATKRDALIAEGHETATRLVAEAEATATIAQIKSGEPFGKVAKQKSIDPSKEQNGQAGWVLPNQINPSIALVMTNLPKGGMSSTPIQTPNGWYIIKLEEKRPFKVPSFDETKNQVRANLVAQKQAEFINALREKAKITQ